MRVTGLSLVVVLALGAGASAQDAPPPKKAMENPRVEANVLPTQEEQAGELAESPKTEAQTATSQPAGGQTEDIAAQATDPSAILMQMQFQFIERFFEEIDSDTSTGIVQSVLPFGKYNVMRATLPITSSPEPNRVGGLGDLVVLDFFLFPAGKSSIGIGPALSFPTATDDALGSGKFSLGPAFLWIYKGVPKTITGLLVENLTSVTGDSDRNDVNTFLFQPIFTRHFKWGYIGWSGQQMSYDWENDAFSIPVGVSIGKVFKAQTPWNIYVEPFYLVNTEAPNAWGLRVGWTAIFPSFHW